MLGEESSQFPCEMTDKSLNDRGILAVTDCSYHRADTIADI